MDDGHGGRPIPVLDKVAVRVETQLMIRDVEAPSRSAWDTYLGVINEVLHNLFFVEPTTIPVVEPLR